MWYNLYKYIFKEYYNQQDFSDEDDGLNFIQRKK